MTYKSPVTKMMSCHKVERVNLLQSHKMIEETIQDIDLKLFDLVREVMARKSRIQVVIRTIARFLHCSSIQSREAARLEPLLEYMRKAWWFVYMAGTEET